MGKSTYNCGFCYRYPLKHSWSDFKYGNESRVYTMKNSWCGEFKKKKTKNEKT